MRPLFPLFVVVSLIGFSGIGTIRLTRDVIPTVLHAANRFDFFGASLSMIVLIGLIFVAIYLIPIYLVRWLGDDQPPENKE